jgi:hypothetical protein
MALGASCFFERLRFQSFEGCFYQAGQFLSFGLMASLLFWWKVSHDSVVWLALSTDDSKLRQSSVSAR